MEKRNLYLATFFVISDKGNDSLSYSNVRLTRTNAGWHISYCFEIDDMIRKLKSSAHTDFNIDKYKDKEHLLNVSRKEKMF
jgi:hypothetical protein